MFSYLKMTLLKFITLHCLCRDSNPGKVQCSGNWGLYPSHIYGLLPQCCFLVCWVYSGDASAGTKPPGHDI